MNCTIECVNELVLSLFPGVDLLGRAFAAEGYSVVKGPDRIFDEDIRNFHVPAKRFNGVIGGPPCQGFSSANRERTNPEHSSVVNSLEMLQQFCRLVVEAKPDWFLCENVPGVPDIFVEGYEIQRLAISDLECGGVQIRMRHIQFGHPRGYIIRPERVNDGVNRRSKKGRKATSLTTRPVSKWSTFKQQCERQGLEKPLSLPGWSKEAKFRAVGNGVPMKMGRALAAAVSSAAPRMWQDCPCWCGRTLTGQKKAATTTCRKRLQLRRDAVISRAAIVVTADGRQSP